MLGWLILLGLLWCFFSRADPDHTIEKDNAEATIITSHNFYRVSSSEGGHYDRWDEPFLKRVSLEIYEDEYVSLIIGNPGRYLRLRLNFAIDRTIVYNPQIVALSRTHSTHDADNNIGSDIFYIGHYKLRLPVVHGWENAVLRGYENTHGDKDANTTHPHTDDLETEIDKVFGYDTAPLSANDPDAAIDDDDDAIDDDDDDIGLIYSDYISQILDQMDAVDASSGPDKKKIAFDSDADGFASPLVQGSPLAEGGFALAGASVPIDGELALGHGSMIWKYWAVMTLASDTITFGGHDRYAQRDMRYKGPMMPMLHYDPMWNPNVGDVEEQHFMLGDSAYRQSMHNHAGQRELIGQLLDEFDDSHSYERFLHAHERHDRMMILEKILEMRYRPVTYSDYVPRGAMVLLGRVHDRVYKIIFDHQSKVTYVPKHLKKMDAFEIEFGDTQTLYDNLRKMRPHHRLHSAASHHGSADISQRGLETSSHRGPEDSSHHAPRNVQQSIKMACEYGRAFMDCQSPRKRSVLYNLFALHMTRALDHSGQEHHPADFFVARTPPSPNSHANSTVMYFSMDERAYGGRQNIVFESPLDGVLMFGRNTLRHLVVFVDGQNMLIEVTPSYHFFTHSVSNYYLCTIMTILLASWWVISANSNQIYGLDEKHHVATAISLICLLQITMAIFSIVASIVLYWGYDVGRFVSHLSHTPWAREASLLAFIVIDALCVSNIVLNGITLLRLLRYQSHVLVAEADQKSASNFAVANAVSDRDPWNKRIAPISAQVSTSMIRNYVWDTMLIGHEPEQQAMRSEQQAMRFDSDVVGMGARTSDAPAILATDAPAILKTDAPEMLAADAPATLAAAAPMLLVADAPMLLVADAPMLLVADEDEVWKEDEDALVIPENEKDNNPVDDASVGHVAPETHGRSAFFAAGGKHGRMVHKLAFIIERWMATLTIRRYQTELSALFIIWFCLAQKHHTIVDIGYLVVVGSALLFSATILSLEAVFQRRHYAMVLIIIAAACYIFMYFGIAQPVIHIVWGYDHPYKHALALVFLVTFVFMPAVYLYTMYQKRMILNKTYDSDVMIPIKGALE